MVKFEMEHSGEFSCHDCNMTFRSLGLLDKHVARFCIGSDLGDPVMLRRQVEVSQPGRAAVSGVSPKRTQTPDLISLREQRRKLLRQKEEWKTDPQDNTVENLVISKLTEEFHRLRISVEEGLTRKHERAIAERLQEAYEHHGQKLVEIRALNTQLEHQRMEIEHRLSELSEQGNSSHPHLEDLLQELKEQEEKNEEILHQLSTQINGLQGTKEADVSSDLPEDKKIQHVSFDLISVEGTLTSQIRSLRLAYMQSGGFDPEVLAHMHDLQAEAYTLEQARTQEEQKMGRRRTKPSHRVVDSYIMAMENENQRLEEEILRLQLVRKRHREDEAGSALHLVQRHQIHQLANLQAEISSLRKELGRGSEKGVSSPPPQTLPGVPPDQTYLGKALDHPLKNWALMSRHALDSMDTLSPAPYDPVAGFVIFYDMVMGMDVTFRGIRLVAVLYSGGQEMGQLTPIPSVRCQPAGALAYPLSGNPGNYTLLAVKQAVPRIQPSQSLSLVLEVQAAVGLHSPGREVHDLKPQGWTKLQLFDQHNQVQSGFWRIPFRCLPVRPALSLGQLNSVPQLDNMEIYLRVVNARDGDVQSLIKIDPNNTSHYKFPAVVLSYPATVSEGTTPDNITTFI